MVGTVIKFGDIFRHNEKEYVLLAQTSEIIYAALILDLATTEEIKKMSDYAQFTNAVKRKQHKVYSIVILEIQDFKGRGAHFARTDASDHQTTTFDVTGSVTEEDRRHIRDEILLEGSAVSGQLIEIVKGLNIV